MTALTPWERAIDFHGHSCPGLAIGFKAVEAIMEHPKFKGLPYGHLVCLTENDACGVDAIQCLLGCSVGKGNLVFRDLGKHAYSFYNRDNGDSLRLIAKRLDSGSSLSREERLKAILNAPANELFEYTEPRKTIPEKERLFLTVACEQCGEPTAEHRIRFSNNKKLCLDCFEEYERRW
jgi:formylmethanofuran dehydrogenase subunit E